MASRFDWDIPIVFIAFPYPQEIIWLHWGQNSESAGSEQGKAGWQLVHAAETETISCDNGYKGRSSVTSWKLQSRLAAETRQGTPGCCYRNVGGAANLARFSTTLNNTTHSEGFPACVYFYILCQSSLF